MNFKKLHNFGSDRIDILEKASFQVTVCGVSTTAVAVSSADRQFGVTVAHFLNLIRCPDSDISLIMRCPSASFSLDAFLYMESRVGDEAVVFGHGVSNNIKNYRATIGGFYGANVSGTVFNVEVIIRANSRYMVGTDQVPGFSGAGVLNGYGIIGIASGSLANSTNAVIVPWSDSDIYMCIQRQVNAGTFFPVNCSSSIIAMPSLLNRIEKNLFSLIKKESNLLTRCIDWIYMNF